MHPTKVQTESQLEPFKIQLKKSLRNLEARLSQYKYLCSDEISIADISAAMELDQTRFIELDLSGYPLTKAWLHRVIDENPILLETSALVRKLAAMSVQKQKREAKAK